jgi:hypothetical protein
MQQTRKCQFHRLLPLKNIEGTSQLHTLSKFSAKSQFLCGLRKTKHFLQDYQKIDSFSLKNETKLFTKRGILNWYTFLTLILFRIVDTNYYGSSSNLYYTLVNVQVYTFLSKPLLITILLAPALEYWDSKLKLYEYLC